MMARILLAGAFVAVATAAMAASDVPTELRAPVDTHPAKSAKGEKSADSVPLTRDEFDRVLKAENMKAICNFSAQQEAAKAQDVYKKINEAFK